MRTRIKAARFVITPPDNNHNYWHLMFAEENLTSDVIIEIEDMIKFKEELDKWIGIVPPKESYIPIRIRCPKCGSTRVRIVYKDNECSEVDFYDCTICSTVFHPSSIPRVKEDKDAT